MSESPPHDAQRAELLDVIRARRDHYRTVYFQQEGRAQFLIGMTIATGGALLAGAPWDGTWIGLVAYLLCGAPIVLAMLAGCLVFLPLDGRRFPGGLDRVITRWALGSSPPRYTTKPGPGRPEAERLQFIQDFVRDRVVRNVDVPYDDPVFVAEAYHTWALWFVHVRRARMLTKAVVLMAIAVLTAGGAYAVRVIVPTVLG